MVMVFIILCNISYLSALHLVTLDLYCLPLRLLYNLTLLFNYYLSTTMIHRASLKVLWISQL